MASLSERLEAARREAQAKHSQETQAERDAREAQEAEAARWESTPEDITGASPLDQDDDFADFADEETPLPPPEANTDPDSETPQEEEQQRESLRTRAITMGTLALNATGNFIAGQPARFANTIRNRRERKSQQREVAALDLKDATDRRMESLITDDKEILGGSVHLRRTIRKTSMGVTNNLHKARVEARGVASSPRKFFMEKFRDRNELKIQRLEDKIASNPDSPHFKRDRERLAMYKARRNHWDGKLDAQSSKHAARVEKLGKKTEARKERYQREIDTYIYKKVEAIRKKKYREKQKTEGIGKFDFRAQAEFFRQLPEADKRRITAEAIEAVRAKNIKKGKLSEDYQVDLDSVKRSIDNYGRTVR